MTLVTGSSLRIVFLPERQRRDIESSTGELILRKEVNIEMQNLKEITSLKEIKTIRGWTSEEQETTIVMPRNSTKVEIWSNDNTMITKLAKTWQKNTDEWKCFMATDTAGNPTGYFFFTTKKGISFRSGVKKKRTLTEEQKAAQKERLIKATATRRKRKSEES